MEPMESSGAVLDDATELEELETEEPAGAEAGAEEGEEETATERAAARRAHLERSEAREVKEQLRYLNQVIRAATQAQGEPEAEPDDPEPDFDEDQKAWHRWNARHAVREQYRAARRELEPREREAVARQQFGQVVAALNEGQDAYEATEEGQGFSERLEGFVLDGIEGLVEGGLSPVSAKSGVQHFVTSLGQWALQNGLNPGAVVDSMIAKLRSGKAPAGRRGERRAAGPTGSLGDVARRGNGSAVTNQMIQRAMAQGIKPEELGKQLAHMRGGSLLDRLNDYNSRLDRRGRT